MSRPMRAKRSTPAVPVPVRRPGKLFLSRSRPMSLSSAVASADGMAGMGWPHKCISRGAAAKSGAKTAAKADEKVDAKAGDRADEKADEKVSEKMDATVDATAAATTTVGNDDPLKRYAGWDRPSAAEKVEL